jgi:prolyl oligopeptidase
MTSYPAAPRSDDVDVLAGHSFPDPFRPLENDDDPGVKAWQAAQAELADSYVAGVAGADALRERVDRYNVGHVYNFEVPRFAGRRWFRKVHREGEAQAHLVVADEPMGDGRVVLEPGEHADEGGRVPFVSWLSPSPDGRLLAVGLCHDGSENNTIRIVEVESGRVLDDRPPQVLMDGYLGGAQWFPDGGGFLFVAFDGPRERHELRVFRHDVGRPPRAEPEHVPLIETIKWLGVVVSRDGRWAVASQGVVSTKPVSVIELSAADSRWRPFVTELDANVAGHIVGDEYVAVTDHGAQRGRLVAIPLTSPPNADPSTWRVVVPESDAVLRNVRPVGDRLYLTELVDTYARVRIVDLDGNHLGEVPLPGRGAMGEFLMPLATLPPRGHPDEYLFGFSSLTESWGTYHYRPEDGAVETLIEPAARVDAMVEDLECTSTDGTRVPYRVVHRADVTPDEPRPALLFGYGGFNSPWVPQWPGPMAAFVDAGGIFVHAHLRGGGELGLDMWESGRLKQKQNCYEDLFAIAEDLVAGGWSATDRLAVTGGSNGGLLSGVAITQRPDLWRAVVPRVPILDLIGACRGNYGRDGVAMEFADVDDPDDVLRLATFSPYQLVEDGTEYPAVWLDVGETDPRCPAWHGRKFAARLQEATASDRPILIRVWPNVGHGDATARDAEIAQDTAWLAFVFDQLGLDARTLAAREEALA